MEGGLSMVNGIAGGLIMAGLVLGAVLNSILLLFIFAAAGFMVAGIAEAVRRHKEKEAVYRELSYYPPYGY